MKLFLIIAAILLEASFSFGQKNLRKCPKYSVIVDSVSIINTKFENNLRKRVQKYKPEIKIVSLRFNYNYKQSDSVLILTLLNDQNYSYYQLIEHRNIYGYFTIDSVLFIVENENVPQHLFLLSKNSRVLDTENIDCYSITVGQLSGIECNYKVKTKRGNIKLRKKSAFISKTKQMIKYIVHRIFNIFRKDERI